MPDSFQFIIKQSSYIPDSGSVVKRGNYRTDGATGSRKVHQEESERKEAVKTGG
jgi:hypothetical protein